ncbi:carbohydrate kinase family protein [Clostridiaceae bacterium HSG29]|nr:carbohydrate kinase family protein [Clostridiaceae bacterium HSG29]
MTDDYILVLGASVVDIFGFCDNEYTSFDSIPGIVKVSFGGVSRNIAENLARMEINTKFISVLGDDEMGLQMISHAKDIGYDVSDSLILENNRTPTYLAVLNENGEMVSGINDMTNINKLDVEYLKTKKEIIKNSLYAFVDADNPENLEYLLNEFKDTKFILDPISAVKTRNILPFIGKFHTIKPNKLEAEVISGMKIENEEDLLIAAERIHDLGVERMFITLDKNGVFYSDGKTKGLLKALNPTVKNVTGAGDSFVAGIGYGYVKNLEIGDIAKIATAMAFITISDKETIHPNLRLEKVLDKVKKINWEEKKYN